MPALDNVAKLAESANSISDAIDTLNRKKATLQAKQASNENIIETLEHGLEVAIDKRKAIGDKIAYIDKQLGTLSELKEVASRADGLIARLDDQAEAYENRGEAVLSSKKRKAQGKAKKGIKQEED